MDRRVTIFEEARPRKSKGSGRQSSGGESQRQPPREPKPPKELTLRERDPEAYELAEVKKVLEQLVSKTEKAVLSEEMKLERQREKEAQAIEKARNKEQQGTEREVRWKPSLAAARTSISTVVPVGRAS